MKLNFRRFLAMFLSIVMVAGMLPAAVFAEDGVETTTYVAKVGNTECADADALISALNAASGEVTVEVYGKITTSGISLSNANITKLSFIGMDTDAEICVDGQAYIDVRSTSYPIEYTKLILSHINAGQNIDGFLPQYFSTYNGGNVTYTRCSFPNGVTACGSTANTTYTFNQCTFNNTTSGLYSLWVYGNSTNVVINGGTFSGVRGIKMYSEGSDDFSTLSVTGATFSNTITEKPAIVLTKGESITLTGNTFNNTTGIVEVDDAYASTIDGKIVTINGTEYTVDSDSLELEKAAPTVVEVTTYEGLIAALAGNVKSIKMMNDITATATQSTSYGKAGIVINAGYVLDGNGYTLTINGASSTWDCAIAMKGGEVKNLTIAVAMRGVFMPGADGDVVIDNCEFKNVVYTFNSDAGSTDYTVTVKNTILNGWTSFSAVHKSVTFEKCTFGEGFGNAFCRPYQATTFVDCVFADGYKLDTANVKGGSENLEFTDCTYAGAALSADNNAMFYNGGSVVINGVPTDVTPPTGSNSYAYTTEVDGNVHVWGEGRGNAKESYVLKLYSGDTLIATTKLNNVGGIIDGDVYVTWHFFYPESTDDYWTTTWEEGHPNSAAQPTEVKLYIDGTLVATTDAKMSGADGINPVVWDKLGGVKKIVTGLSGSGTEAEPFLINNLEELKWFRDDVNNGNRYNGQFVKLNADIDLNYEEWMPIGDREKDQGSFLGTFDGGNHIISNLWISEYTKTGAGFFSKVGMQTESVSGTVKNVIFNNVTITSTNSYVGVIAQAPLGALIENVEITGKVAIQGYGYVGGIVGHGYPTINNCSVKADKNSTITATYWGAGAILGFAGDYGAKISNATVSDVAIHAASGGAASVAGSPYGAALTGTTNVKNVNITSNSDYCMSYVAGGGKINGTVVMENVTATASGKAITPGDVVASVDGTMYFDLQSALAAAAAGTGNVTVEILRDVNLTGIDWNPVTVSANGYPVVTVNGNNKTITGLNDMLFAGTWAGKSGLIINDLTIKDSKIVNDKDDTAGTVGVGAFIGYPQASATITLSNCHLVNSIVEGGHWTGGLIGMAGGYNGNDGPVFMNLTITGCSVTGSTITGKGSAGGVIGHGSCAAWTNVVIENTTVSGNTITSTGSSTNKAGSVMGTIGAAGQPTTVNGVTLTGGAFVSATVSGNTVTSAGTTITTIYGRQGTVGGTLEVTGGSYDKYPIEENVSYAAPAEGYVIEENADGTYGLVIAPTSKTYNVSTKAELDAALAAAAEGDTILLTADIDYGTDHLAITQAITLDLGTHTLTTKATNYGLALKNDGCIVTNGKLNHAGTVAAIKVWDAAEISDLEIDVIGTSSSGNTIDGIVIQQNAAGVDLIQKVTIHSTSGQGVDSGIKTYNCGNATEPVIGSMVNVTIDAKSVGLNISAPCGTATNCTIKGGTNGIEIWIKGTYSATLDLVDCDVVGGVFAHDEFSSNPSIANNGTLKLTADGATTGASKDDITLTIARAEKVEGILKDVMDNAQAKVNDTYYATLASAIAAAQNGDTITLLYAEGDAPIAMNGAVYGKTVTITGTATVDWSKGNLFVGRGGEGHGTVIFDNAKLTSASNSSSYGIHVSGREKDTDNKYDGTLIIKNSTIELDYLINRNNIEVDNSTFTVKNGFGIAGRPASETESGTAATATIDIKNGSTVKVLNHNGMGVGRAATVVEGYGILNLTNSTFESTSFNVDSDQGTFNVYGESTVKINKLTGKTIRFQNGAIVKDSTVGGGVFVAGKVTFRGDNKFGMLSDFGTLRDYYGTTADMEWSVEAGASVTLTDKARYGLGYGDKVTIFGSLNDALKARDTLGESDIAVFMHGLVAQESTGWNKSSSLTVKNAYVVLGSNNSFGNKPGNYGGTYTFEFDNVVLNSSRITFYEAGSKTKFTFNRSDVNVGTFMIRDADSVFTLTDTKLVSTTTSNGNDEGNYLAGTLVLNNSSLRYAAPLEMENGTLTLGAGSRLIAPSIIGTGKIIIDATDMTAGKVAAITANASSFAGTIKVINNDKLTAKIDDNGNIVLVEVKTYVAQIGEMMYETFAEALDAVQNGETITLLDVEGSEISKEIEFTKDIEFTITGTAPNYALPVVTFQNATVNIESATILIPELDARQNATINVINSTVHDAGGNSIVKSYYNGAINISGTSVVYTMQVTTMGYITVSDTASLTATWQTNVYGNGMITVENSATFNTAALQLTGKDYSGRDNTDADRKGKPAQITVDGGTLNVGKATASNGADYSYNSSYGINIGTIAGKEAVLDIVNGAKVNIYMADDETANIGADGTVNVNGELTVACRDAAGTAKLVNNGSIVLKTVDSTVTANKCGNVTTSVDGYAVEYADGKYTVVEEVEPAGTITHKGLSLSLTGIVYINDYVTLTGFDGVDLATNAGLLIWKHEVTEDTALYTTADDVNIGLIKGSQGYWQCTDGIPARQYADELWLRVYVQANDGKYYYGPLKKYSVQTYCQNQINKTTTEETLKKLCAAMLHYGAAAQVHFDYNVSDLANANIIELYPSIAWDSNLLTELEVAQHSLPSTNDVKSNKSLSLTGAIAVNFYFNPVTGADWTVASGKVYFWDGVSGELCISNSTNTAEMTKGSNGWYATSDVFAAREYGKTVFAYAELKDTEGNIHYSDVIAYSPEQYAKNKITQNTDADLVDLVKKMVIYGECAKAHLEK